MENIIEKIQQNIFINLGYLQTAIAGDAVDYSLGRNHVCNQHGSRSCKHRLAYAYICIGIISLIPAVKEGLHAVNAAIVIKHILQIIYCRQHNSQYLSWTDSPDICTDTKCCIRSNHRIQQSGRKCNLYLMHQFGRHNSFLRKAVRITVILWLACLILYLHYDAIRIAVQIIILNAQNLIPVLA